jgi:hypothetical protein
LRGLGVGLVSSSSSGTESKDDLGLSCLDELKEDFLGLERGIPNRLCNVLRVPECFGVEGLVEGGRGGSIGMGMADGRCLGRGVPGTTVVFVAVVVDDKGLDGRREGGLEEPLVLPMLSACRRGI